MSDRGSRKNTENENKIEVVQIDGLVVMKLIKHCHEVECLILSEIVELIGHKRYPGIAVK